MKRIILGAVTILSISALVILPLWHIDAAAGNGCKLQGTWIGESPYPLPDNPDFKLRFLATYHGEGDNEGTDVAEWANLPTAPGTSVTSSRGNWEKSGPNTYKYTMMGFLVDSATGTVLSVSRNSGTKTLVDCNTMVVTCAVEYLDPETMEPLMCVPSTATLKRILIQEPCQVSK